MLAIRSCVVRGFEDIQDICLISRMWHSHKSNINYLTKPKSLVKKLIWLMKKLPFKMHSLHSSWNTLFVFWILFCPAGKVSNLLFTSHLRPLNLILLWFQIYSSWNKSKVFLVLTPICCFILQPSPCLSLETFIL